MISFKDQLAKDIEQVFINTEEFADIHILDGVELPCVVNSNSVGNRQYNRSSSFDDGLYEYDIEVIYKYNDYPHMLVYNTNIKSDNGKYDVSNFALDDGMVTLKLVLVN